MATIPIWAIILFFVVDSVVVMGVVLWAIGRNKGNQNTSNTFNNPTSSPFESPFNSSSANASGDDEIVDLLRRGQKIQAIKIYRDRTGAGLKEAKDAVEALERQL